MSSMNRSPNPQQQGQQHHNNNGQHQNSQQRGSNDPHHHTNNNSAADALSYGGGGGGGPSSPSYVHSNQSNNSTSQQQGSRSWSGVSTPHHHQHHVSSVAAPEFSQQHRNAPPPPPTTDFSGSYNSNSNNGGRDGGSSGSSSFHLQQQQQQQAMHHQHHHLHHHHHHQQQNTHSPDPYHGDYGVNHNNNSNSGNNSAPPPPIRLPMNTATTDNSNINKQRECFDGQQQRGSGYNPQYRQQQHQGQMPNGGTPISPVLQGVPTYPNAPLQRQYSNNNNSEQQQLGGGVVPPQFSRSGNNNAAPNGNSMRSQQQGNPQQRGGPPTGSSGSNNSMFPPTVSVGNNHHGAAPHSLSNSNNSGAPPPPPQMGLSHHHHHHHHHQFHHHHMHHSNNNNHVVNQHMDPSSSSSSQQHNNNVVGGNNGVPLPPSAGWAPPPGGAPMPPPHFHQQHHRHQHHQDFNDGVAPAFGHGGGAASVSVGGSYMPQYPQQQHQERQQQQQRGGGSGSAGNNNNSVPMYSPEMPLQHQHQHQQNLQPHHHNHQFHAQLQQHQQQRGAGVSGQQFPSSSQPQQQRSNQRGNNNNHNNSGDYSNQINRLHQQHQLPPPPTQLGYQHHHHQMHQHHHQFPFNPNTNHPLHKNNNNHNNSGDYSNQINRLHQQHQLPPPPAQLGYQHHHHQMHQHHHQFPLNPNTNHHLHNSGRQQLQDGVDQGYFPADGVDQTAAAHGEFAGDNSNNGRGMLSISPEAASSDDSQSSQCVDLYVFLRNKGLLERYILGDLLPEDDAESKGKSPSAAAAAAHTSSSATDEHVGSSGGGGGHRIAVDANYALLRLRDKMRQLDPLWFLHAPLPKLLLDLIKTDVENLRDVGLEPIYVFNGLGASGDVEAFVTPSRTMMQRSQQWKTLDPTFMPDDEAPQLSRDDCIPLNDVFDVSFSEDVEMAVGRYLRSELGVTVITAPFLNWAQMILMHKEGQVKLLFAPPEALMFAYDDTELIMDIETANPMAPVAVVRNSVGATFPKIRHVVELHSATTAYGKLGILEDSLDASNHHHHHQQHAPPVVAKDYSKAGDRFLDFCLLTSTHPAIQSLRASIQLSVEDLYEELSSATPKYRTIQELIEANQPLRSATDNKSEWQKHAKGRCFMRHCIVMSLSPLTDTPLQYLSKSLRNHNHSLLQDAALAGGSGRATIPSNIGGVFGNMVPDGLFFLQLTGLLSVGTMTCITQTYVCDEGPVCDSTDFRDAMHVLISLRTQVTYQLVREIAEPKTVRAATAAISALGENESAAHHHHQQQQAGGQQHPVPYLDRFKSISWVRWYRPILQSVPRPVEIIKLDDWKLPSEIRAAGASNVAGSGPLTTTTTSSANSSPVGRKGNHNNNSFASSSSAAPPAAVAAAPSASVVVNGIVRLDSVIPLKKVLSLNQLATPAVPRGSVTSSESLYTTVQEVYCAVILKSLDLLGYFTHAVQTTVGGQPQHLQLDDNSGSAAGGGNNNNDDIASNNTSSSQVQSDLSPFSREVSYVVDCDPEHQYQYVLLTELVRTQSLSARPIVFADETDAAAGDANVSPSLGAAAAASASTI
ncbi:Hypothetical protein, putative [Bodo saltans]|uniref:Post-transcriptional regulator MKT1 N-terminal domain-containing protein n=1 Tax=Bodo saltans TaxID=75058 RepID=A0A0S4JQ92_BODSA|nr:Hypothetical protein, putative [Bodo saltans]|eukprot:CUG93714.1 Hypothetical protein, putative [Bodo saltans]